MIRRALESDAICEDWNPVPHLARGKIASYVVEREVELEALSRSDRACQRRSEMSTVMASHFLSHLKARGLTKARVIKVG